MDRKNYIVSAIVSVYNSERFIEGFLEDLERQTMADRLEIVVVNSGSQENEEPIIKRYMERYDNIVYIKTENRETVYKAWNRAIKASSGKYITNANTDDRHRKDAYEIMVNFLESRRDVGLVYPNYIITETENETFEKHTPTGYSDLPEFDRCLLMCRNFVGPQPMWSKKIHDEFGFFDETFEVAGDYEFWLRISAKYKCKHIKEYLGLYLKSPMSAARRNYRLNISETDRVIDKYMIRISHDVAFFRTMRKNLSQYFFKLGINRFKKKELFLGRHFFIRSIVYDWSNFKSYKKLIMSFLPIFAQKALRKVKLCVIKLLNVMDNRVDNVTAIIKTFERPKELERLIKSIRKYYPALKIIVADDSRRPYLREDVEYYVLPYDVGISAGRNFLLNKVNTKYFVIFDDDFVCTKNTKIIDMIKVMEKTSIDLVGGDCMEFGKIRKSYHGLLKIRDGILYHLEGKSKGSIGGYPLYDKTLNFFVAKTEKVKEVMWDEKINLAREHADFFLRAKEKLNITYSPRFSIDHFHGSKLYTGERGKQSEEKFNSKWKIKKSAWIRAKKRRSFLKHVLQKFVKVFKKSYPTIYTVLKNNSTMARLYQKFLGLEARNG
ncbi:MAG: glycosyltransferase [Candidatus Omnitrophica bacterium]|nr:glycosyltransferase [Candidatus Omnitrophota bacterium]